MQTAFQTRVGPHFRRHPLDVMLLRVPQDHHSVLECPQGAWSGNTRGGPSRFQKAFSLLSFRVSVLSRPFILGEGHQVSTKHG